MSFENLPRDVMLSVLLHSDMKSLSRVKAVCKSWQQLLLLDDGFWRQKFKMDFGEWEGDDVDFEEKYKIEYGWRCREPGVAKLEGHDGWVRDVIIKGSMLVSGSFDETVRLWDLKQKESMREFRMHSTVYCVAMHGERLFVGLGSGEIHVWSLGSGEQDHTWQAHDLGVRVIALSEGLLISGDNSGLKVWDAFTFERLNEFAVAGRKRLCIDADETFCGLYALKRVNVYHAKKGLLYSLIAGEIVFSVCASAKHIFVGCGLMKIQVWNRASKEHVKTLKCSFASVTSLWRDARRLISASYDGQIRVWDAETLKCISRVKLGVKGGLWCMDSSNGKIAVGFERHGRIHVLDFAS